MPIIRDPARRKIIATALQCSALGLAQAVRPAQAAPNKPASAQDLLHVELRAGIGHAAFWPENPTAIWRYTGRVISGAPHALSFAGHLPVLRLRQGQRLRVDIHNELPELTMVHWHGMHIPSDMDGQPRSPILPGESFSAEFTIMNAPGTYWFHPHPHRRTGFQVYHGLAGLLIVDEPAASPPNQAQDIPLVLQDRNFDAQRQLAYIPHSMDGRMDQVNGFIGDYILVNGALDYAHEVARGPCRLRLLNGSNARIYKLAWSDGRPVTVTGTDGGALDTPINLPYLTLAPAQRRELWVDFSALGAGEQLQLVSLPFRAGTVSTTPSSGQNLLPLGSGFEVMSFRASADAAPAPALPEALDQAASSQALRALLDPALAHNRHQPRRFTLDMDTIIFTMNGRVMPEDLEVAADEIVRLNTTEIWEFHNLTIIPHPIHIHDVQFRILQRAPIAGTSSQLIGLGWGDLDEGMLDDGWHDTVLVMPGERVSIIMRFQDFTGLYMYHCHNLEHEDGGMMRYFRVDA